MNISDSITKCKKSFFAAYVKAIGNYDGSAMGSAYVITDCAKVWKESKNSEIGTRAYEMEFRAILAVVSSLPDNSRVNIYTNDKLLENINHLKTLERGAKFYDLKKSFIKEKGRLKSVNIIYKSKSCNNMYFNSVEGMAKDEFLSLCQRKGIKNKLIA